MKIAKSAMMQLQLLLCIDRYKVINFNKLFITDYYGFIVDIDMKEYCKVKHFKLDRIDSSKLDSRKASYKAKFIENVEN